MDPKFGIISYMSLFIHFLITLYNQSSTSVNFSNMKITYMENSEQKIFQKAPCVYKT